MRFSVMYATECVLTHKLCLASHESSKSVSEQIKEEIKK